jgi:predicted metal-dependent hydrolase
VTHKSNKVAEMVAKFAGQVLDARYLGYFDCFNRQLFYEAHDVLEDLWLLDRHGPSGDFFKGLIQLAGAFVHLQKHRLRPADALFQLAERNLRKYPARHESADVAALLEVIAKWRGALSGLGFTENPLSHHPAPMLPWPGGSGIV